jgi:DNA-binding PadR family transcriptional regulator
VIANPLDERTLEQSTDRPAPNGGPPQSGSDSGLRRASMTPPQASADAEGVRLHAWNSRQPRTGVPSATAPIPVRTSAPDGPASPPPDQAHAASSATTPAPPVRPSPDAAPFPRSAANPNEGVGLARRVITHLSQLGHLGPDDVAPVGFTQQGMAAALQVRQGTLVKVLQRLRAANVVTVDRRHVSGLDRRLLIYRLTALGESVARDMRHPGPDPRPVVAPGEWIETPTSERPARTDWRRDATAAPADGTRYRSRV